MILRCQKQVRQGLQGFADSTNLVGCDGRKAVAVTQYNEVFHTLTKYNTRNNDLKIMQILRNFLTLLNYTLFQGLN